MRIVFQPQKISNCKLFRHKSIFHAENAEFAASQGRNQKIISRRARREHRVKNFLIILFIYFSERSVSSVRVIFFLNKI